MHLCYLFFAVHRDIKPSNIFILEGASPSASGADASNRLVLGDFGLSLPLENGLFTNSLDFFAVTSSNANGEVGTAETGAFSGGTFGSLGWMAPEMCVPSGEALVRSGLGPPAFAT